MAVARYIHVLGATCLLVAGCAHVTNDAQALCGQTASCNYDPDGGYRFRPELLKSDLIVLTFSGGGLRATALAYGTLQALSRIAAPDDPSKSLLDEVNIVSSLSGGSVTAGWFALEGRDGLAAGNRLDRFISSGIQGELIARGLNPVTLSRYVFTPYQRSDVLADTLAGELYGDSTFENINRLYRSGRRPFVILNATDTGHETRFPFIQNRFDLICSDLEKYSLANAVTASADFPLVFTAAGVHNFSGDTCPVTHDSRWNSEGPMRWIEKELDPGKHGRYVTNELIEIRAAREAREYLCPDRTDRTENVDLEICNRPASAMSPDGRTLHLLDGGIADNLGIQSVLGLEDTSTYVPGLYERLVNTRSDAATPYRAIQRVLFIVVNARSRGSADIDKKVYPPGLVSTGLQIMDTSLDSTILTTQDYLTAELEAISRRRTDYLRDMEIGPTSHATDQPDQIYSSGQASRLKVGIVSIDFDMLVDEGCRRAFASIPTSWKLNVDAIDALENLPALMLANSRELERYFKTANGEWNPPPPPEEYEAVCRRAERAVTAYQR
jgi:NTE family protein